MPLARLDDEMAFMVARLVEAKFSSLFSFLFGVGFAVCVQRAAARGADAVRLFRRRLSTPANAARRTGLMFFPRVFGMFLPGFYVGRHNIFATLERGVRPGRVALSDVHVPPTMGLLNRETRN